MGYNTDSNNTKQKIKAREENVRLYRALSGLQTIPKDRQYWTLANRQDASPDSEINQLVSLELLTEDQFHGVDRDEALIEANRLDHPEAHWHAGSWEDVIAEDGFNPALVYLDTTGTAGCPETAALVTRTMQRCPADCVLLANVMLYNWHTGKDYETQELLRNIADRCTAAELEAWGWEDLKAFEYSSGTTKMVTVALHRRA